MRQRREASGNGTVSASLILVRGHSHDGHAVPSVAETSWCRHGGTPGTDPSTVGECSLSTRRKQVRCITPIVYRTHEVRLSVGNTLCLPKAATMSQNAKAHHIVPHPSGGWSVKRAGRPNLTGHFDTKQEAVAAGRRISREQNTELVIHGLAGMYQGQVEIRGDIVSTPDTADAYCADQAVSA